MDLSQVTLNTIIARIINEIIDEGINVTPFEIDTRLALFLEQNDLTSPTMDPDDLRVKPKSSSSSSLYNDTNEVILDDLSILYRNMFLLSNQSMKTFDRWRSRITNLEAQLDNLGDRVQNLLIVTQDTEGFFNFVSDVFADTEKIDIPNSSMVVDLNREQVTIGPNDSGATRVNLNLIKPEDISFIVLTRKDLQANAVAEGGEPINAFVDATKFWQNRLFMNKPGPVVVELKVKLGDEPVKISRISMKLHAANTNSSVTITPLISNDNFNFTQLSTASFSQSVTNKATFTFPPTTAKYVKFILAKDGFDHLDGLLYVYEFGADEIAFYKEGFLPDSSNILFTKALSVKDTDGNLAKFSRVSLNVCELVPSDDSNIDYAVAASNTIIDPASLNFVSIDPLERSNPINPTIVNFTDLTEFEFGNTTSAGLWVKVSYDADNADENLVNPGPSFALVADPPTVTASGVGTGVTTTTSGIRYVLPTNSERILDYQFDSGLDFKDNDIVIFRNLGLQGDNTNVRGVQAGWGFAEPNYNTTIEVKNSSGIVIDFGDKNIIIDGVLTKGEVRITQGVHIVGVHKSNFAAVASTATTEDELKALDTLYPHNHKLLIEGYPYPSGFTGDQIYTGVDLFAEQRMRQVSPFDIFRSIPTNDYNKFALDLDAQKEDSLGTAKDPSRVIIVKTDASNPDFINERFVVRLKVNTSTLSFTYIVLRADLTTNDPEVAPILDSYRIRLGK